MQGSLGEAREVSFAGYSERNSNLVRFRNAAIRRTPISHPGNGASAPTRKVMKRRNIAIRSPNITHILFFELQMPENRQITFSFVSYIFRTITIQTLYTLISITSNNIIE